MQEKIKVSIAEQGIAIINESHALSKFLTKAVKIKNIKIATIHTIQQDSSGVNTFLVLPIDCFGLCLGVSKSFTVTPYRSAICFKTNTSGKHSPFSHLEIALSE